MESIKKVDRKIQKSGRIYLLIVIAIKSLPINRREEGTKLVELLLELVNDTIVRSSRYVSQFYFV
jgi:hypothetical protein